MAKEEQLNKLRQGAGKWNTWRRMRGPKTYIDLSEAILKSIDLSEANLSEADFSGANLSEADLSGANLSNANLSNTTLSGTTLSRANLSGANLSGANLSGADLIKADLRDASLRGTILNKAYINGAALSRAILSGAVLSGAVLSGATLSNTDLSGATLSNTDLSNTDLSGATLSNTDLSSAILSSAILSSANLSGANLSGANLSGANLSGANLSGANLSGTILSNTILNGSRLNNAILSSATMGRTVFINLDLSTVKGLETAHHMNPSTIGTDTLELSKGIIPEAFLRGIGMSNIFITHTYSLAQSPIQYYTCFISYSSKDELFAQQLHNDLQQKGVRCWFAPEDMKIGDKIRARIDESIQRHDKLLLILSKHAMESNWVEYEVEAALAKEQREERTVLFPVRLDNTVIVDRTTWTAHIQNTRHIGNFECWEDHGAYIKAFDRLLRDLKADATKDIH